ncbi:MAG: hypothetical protein ACR2RV_07070 [Verrucomicrobiales bacterium]
MCRGIRSIIFRSALLLLTASQAGAADEAGGVVTAAATREIPLWPFYIAMSVGAIVACIRLVGYFVGREAQAKVFPKLEFRRRLFAPYSGGNHASIEFGSGQDHA